MCVSDIIILGLAWVVVVKDHPCFFWDTSLYHDGYCYKLGTVLSNWTSAQVLCGQNISQARLAEPVTVSSLEYLAKTVILSGEDWWIGGVVRNNSPVWSSSHRPIQSGKVDTAMVYWHQELRAGCVQLAVSEKGRLIPAMSVNDCSARQKAICQLYVGNPCDMSLPGGDYFNDGTCYKLNNATVYIDEAAEICGSEHGHLAEFYSNESYYYFKKRMSDLAVVDIFVAANTTVYLEDYNITGHIMDSFRLLTCDNAKAYLWAETDVASSASRSPMGGLTNEYYAIEYGIFGTVVSSFKYCNYTTCYVLATGNGANVNCRKFLDVYMYWTSVDNCIYLSDLMVNFTTYNMTILPISRMAISMDNGDALFVFPDPLHSTVISLGGGDIHEEGVYKWLSTDTDVAIDDWMGGEPNDWEPGEDHMSWRFYGLAWGLNDYNGAAVLARPLCQRDILLVTYLMVLPESDALSKMPPEVHVTSGHLDVAYLHFTQRRNSGEITLVQAWVTSYRNVIFGISDGVELRDTGFYHGVVVLKATNHVTVVLYHTSFSRTGSTLVLPVNLNPSGYFVLTNPSQESGSYITITALESNTDVVIKFPRDQLEPFTLSISGFHFQYIGKASVCLDQFDTAHIKSPGDFSGSFVYSRKPVVVYSGSKYTQPNSDVTDSTLEMAFPVDSLSTQYVAFTTRANDSGVYVTHEKLRLLALYDNTEITIYGTSSANVTLAKAGNITELVLPSDGVFVLNSDPYHPFYVARLALTSVGACTASLLPESLWRSQYDLYVKYDQEEVAFVVEKNSLSSFLVDGVYNSTCLRPCVDIEGTSLVGCTMSLERGIHHFGFNDSLVNFMAYGSRSFRDGTGCCHALGSSHRLETRPPANTSQESFPSVEYINLPDTEPFPAPYPKETSTSGATSRSQTTRAQTTKTNDLQEGIWGIDISAIKGVRTTATTIKITDASTSPMPTRQGSELTATTTDAITASPSSPVTRSKNAAADSLSTDTALDTNIPNCLSFSAPKLNLTQEELDSLTRDIVKLLLINTKDTSAFKHRMQSTWEDRPSCHAIGGSGVAIIACFVALFLTNDLLSLFRFLFSSANERHRDHDQVLRVGSK